MARAKAAQVRKIRAAIAKKYGEPQAEWAIEMRWDWPSNPTPTILREGGPYGEYGDGWAIECSFDPELMALAASMGLYLEPYAGYALCVFPR